MPKYPIYVRLLPEAAQKAIGKPHDDGRGAYKLLIDEGFHYDNCMDIFDAGPSVVANINDLKAIKHSLEAAVAIGDGKMIGMICAGSAADFRVTSATLAADLGTVKTSEQTLKALSLSVGDKVRYVVS
jgi:arginine N-succinyltransferase